MARVKSLSTKSKMGYCSGIIAESLMYNMFFTYYLVFLTDVVKLPSILAGTISFVAIICDAVADPIIGALSDKDGADKRKFMFRAAFPMGILFVAAFTDIGVFGDVGKFIYYLAVTMLFWLCYAVYTIPYYAVVAEITTDYDERTDIRGTSALINAAGIFTGNALPAVLPAAIIGLGFSARMGWIATAGLLSALSILFAVIAVLSLRHVTLQKAEALSDGKHKKAKDIFTAFIQVLKIKPFKWFVLFVFAFLIASSMIQANFMYLIKECLGMDAEDKMVIVIVVLVGTIALLTPVVTKIATIKDRRFASILFLSISMVGLIIGKIIGITTLPMLFYVAFFMAVGVACFWAVFYSMAYDLVEVDEFVSGERREGVITALPQFFQKFGSAIGMWMVGLVLKLSGYDSGNASAGIIENSSTIIPAVFIAIAIFGLVMFPVTKERFHKLQDVLAKKNRGEDYDTSGLERIL
ncbi:MAG: MFS transporter [Clostridiales bacterium]|nr:MFS transporter [Clostridiales bacterium]